MDDARAEVDVGDTYVTFLGARQTKASNVHYRLDRCYYRVTAVGKGLRSCVRQALDRWGCHRAARFPGGVMRNSLTACQ